MWVIGNTILATTIPLLTAAAAAAVGVIVFVIVFVVIAVAVAVVVLVRATAITLSGQRARFCLDTWGKRYVPMRNKDNREAHQLLHQFLGVVVNTRKKSLFFILAMPTACVRVACCGHFMPNPNPNNRV